MYIVVFQPPEAVFSLSYLCCWVLSVVQGPSLVGQAGLLFAVARALPTAVASPCGARTRDPQASVAAAHGLVSCGSRTPECGISGCGTQA